MIGVTMEMTTMEVVARLLYMEGKLGMVMQEDLFLPVLHQGKARCLCTHHSLKSCASHVAQRGTAVLDSSWLNKASR